MNPQRERIARPLKAAVQGTLLGSCLMLSLPGYAGITFQFEYTDAPNTGFFDPVWGTIRQDALNIAASAFSDMFGSYFSNSGTILLEAYSSNNHRDNTLASSSSYFYAGGKGFGEDGIKEVIIDKLITGHDHNGNDADGKLHINFGHTWELDFNRPAIPSYGWYSGTRDFYGTLFHEFTHALGFNSTIFQDGTSLAKMPSWSRFDSFIVDKDDIPIIDHDTFELNQAAWDVSSVGNWGGGGTEGLFFGGPATMEANNGYSVTLYTPGEWSDGSSVAHLDGRIAGRDWMMMTPSSPAGPLTREYSDIEVAILTDLGYSVSVVPEPETWSMMLAGLALLGSIAQRRMQWALPA